MLKLNRYFSVDGVDPYTTVEWKTLSAQIKDDQGQVIFEQDNCEVPKDWSQLATNVVCSKYFYGELGSPNREYSIKQLIHRVARTIADWGFQDGYFDKVSANIFYDELVTLLLHQIGAFNSPVWFNVGLYHQYGATGAKSNYVYNPDTDSCFTPENPYEYPQCSACFIQSVDDSMEDIMELAKSEATLFKFGSGTGTDLSTLRSKRERLNGGGKPSGPLSFMRVYDQIAGVVKSGGKTRRAAKMQSLKDWHPDIMEFIECKWKEEQKAKCLIEKGGYESNFNGEAYSSIAFQNANLSVRLSHQFFEQLLSNPSSLWNTKFVTTGEAGPSYPIKDVMRSIATCAWNCGDPGVQYDDTINTWHTCPSGGPINASNPCSEYMFLDNTACNLASINLMKFFYDGDFNTAGFSEACRIFFFAQEILVGRSSYPTKKIAKNSYLYRPLGLGYANLGSLIMSYGYPYDSDAARALCGFVTAVLHGAANLASAELAQAVGPFQGYQDDREHMIEIMEDHANEIDNINFDLIGEKYGKEARELWGWVLKNGREYGFRNAQATVLAPTGTISFMMDCDTTGIEPDIALVKYKQLAGGGMLKIINKQVPIALRNLGYSKDDSNAICQYIEENDTIEGCNILHDYHLPIFDCAFTPANGKRSIRWQAHVEMMAAAQPFLSGAISKTVNMPRNTTIEDIEQAYIMGWEKGLKALAIYRDGSKDSQPLNTSLIDSTKTVPTRKRLPNTRHSITHKFSISGHEGYFTVGLFDDGNPGELFITMSKEGSTIAGLMDAFGVSISLGLQYGVPIQTYCDKFKHTRFEPSGHTKNKDIKIAKSVLDYIFRWLENHYTTEEPIVIPLPNVVTTTKPDDTINFDGPPCSTCGSLTYPNGACYLCANCGTSMGCS